MSEDVGHLAMAWALAARGARTCRPNPAVGCVLVRDGAVVGRGWHERAGGPHAEVVALRDAGPAARGATAYVTLEPCDHTGRTGPCSVALVEAGVARVVAARRDPIAEHAGGLVRLERAGVAVEVVGLDGWQDTLLHRWRTRQRTGRPWVTLKLAVDRDGASVPSDGRWITGAVARTAVHQQRAAHDAVLVGVGTVLADDPRLDVRHVATAGPQPRPVVLDTHAWTPVTATVVARGALVVTTAVAPAPRVAGLRAAGAEVVVVTSRDGHVELHAALAAVAERGITEVYAEPGESVATALVRAGLVDELLLHRGGGVHGGWPAAWEAGRWSVVRSRPLGADRELVARPDRPAA